MSARKFLNISIVASVLYVIGACVSLYIGDQELTRMFLVGSIIWMVCVFIWLHNVESDN
jgi:hypothetical protein